jgi:hypothetical protein
LSTPTHQLVDPALGGSMAKEKLPNKATMARSDDHPPASPEQLKKFKGVYQLSDSNKVYITLANDTLYYQGNNRSKRALFAETENIFFTLADTRGRKVFTSDEQGKMILRERRNGQDVVWKKIE